MILVPPMRRFASTLHRAALALTLASCTAGDASQSAAQDELAVRRGDLHQRVVLNGEVEARRGLLTAVPKLPNWETTIKWIAEDGALVKEGDRVVELDSSSFSTTLEQKRIAVTEARQQLARHDASADKLLEEKVFDVDRRRIELEQAKIAANVPSSIISRREYEDRQLALQRATIEFEKATESLASARRAASSERENFLITIRDAEKQLTVSDRAITDMTLTAGANGIFIVGELPWEARKLQAGDRVFVSFPIGTIPDLSTLQISATLWDVDDGKIRAGDRVDITIDAHPDKHFSGTVASIAPVAQETTRNALRRAFKTVITLDEVNPDIMRPGFSARLVITRPLAKNALLAPRSAIVSDQKSARLLLHDGGSVDIKVGACNAQKCVVDGAKEGTRLRSAHTETKDA